MAISIFLNYISSINSASEFNVEPIIVKWDGKPCKASKYNGIGRIEISNKTGGSESWMWRLRIDTQAEILTKLLPILNIVKNNMLLNKRFLDINLFIDACLIIKKGEHNTLEGNDQISILSSQLSSKLSFDTKANLPVIQNNLNNQNVVGFVDAEGCFSFSIINNSYIKYSFVITQLASEKEFLSRLINFFGTGNVTIYNSKKEAENSQGVYTVQGKQNLAELIVPFFTNNKLQTIKQYSFERFARALNIDLNNSITKEEKIRLVKEIQLETEHKRPVVVSKK